MSLDLRRLFDEVRIEWRDRGPNTSKRSLNIRCPYCPDDPSHHMRVSLDGGGYSCLRDRRHHGASLHRLLWGLGVSRVDAIELVRKHGGSDSIRAAPYVEKPETIVTKQWKFFEPAAESSRMMDYLYGRGFPLPEKTAKDYDLRYATGGKWAQRIIFPVRNLEGEVTGWSARSLRPDIQPRYLMSDDAIETLYIPRQVGGSLVISEGPFDALKIAVAMENTGTTGVALLGLHISPRKQLQLIALSAQIKAARLALDSEVPLGQKLSISSALALALRSCNLCLLRLPEGFKDPGEMPLPVIRRWLSSV